MTDLEPPPLERLAVSAPDETVAERAGGGFDGRCWVLFDFGPVLVEVPDADRAALWDRVQYCSTTATRRFVH